MSKGILLIVSGPSGCGKGTILHHLLKNREYCYSVSATTRKPREGEVHGVNYFFMDNEEFEALIDQGKILEYTRYCDNYYGTPRDYLEEQLEKGLNVVLEIETEGAMNVKKVSPDALSIFIAPPSVEELEKRLIGRGTEDMDTVAKRLKKAGEEMLLAADYDVVLVNENGAPDKVAEEIHKAVMAKKATMQN